MKNKKGLIFLLIILMSVGFAAVTTTLIINGSTKVAENEDDYQVYFSGAVVDKEDYTNEIISKDKKTITFETKELKSKDDVSELKYNVTNGSTQYDASVSINVSVDENDLIEVTNTYDDSKNLSARETRTGVLTVKLKRGITEAKDIKIKVELIFNAEEREEIDTTPIETKLYSISGYFVDKEGNAMPNANIAVFSENPQFVTTDDYGYFYVGNLERGKHELYYIEKSDVNKTKEEIKKNALDETKVTTASTKTIIFNNGHEIKDKVIGEENNKTFKITLVKNNGEADEEIEVRENTKYQNLPIPNKVGTKFLYWKDEDGNIITENTIVKATTSKLYAYYGENTYKIAYNLNGGVSSNTPTGATFGKDIEIEAPTKEVTVTIDDNNQGATLVKTSYTGNLEFTGWTGSNLSDTALVNNVSWNGTLTKGTTFKNLTSTLNETVTLTANYDKTNVTLDIPIKDGYTCGYTDETTGSIKYTTNVTVSDDLTLYVKCNPNTYTITFDSDGGTAIDSKTITYDSKIGTLTNPTKTGYNFAGWYLETESITSESVYKYAKDITLKAKWTEATNTKYTVNYYLQTLDKKYETATESIVYTGTTNKTVDAELKTYEGFVTPSKQTVKILADGSAKVDYYYVRKELKVTFINASTKKEVTYLYGKENQAFTNNGFSKTGYTLTGYSDKENGSKNYEVTNTVTGTFIDTNYPSKTVYAVFTANTYKVVFNNNGGSGSMDTITCTYDKDCELSKNTITKTGYTFAGWSKKSDGEIEYTNNETAKNLATSGNITLYAKWTANTYTITYNANGGSGSMSKTTCTYDTNCTLAANTFTKDGYVFASWTKNSTSGVSYKAGVTVKNLATSGNVTMYAKWTVNTVSFSSDSWKTIQRAVQAGDTSKYNVGDTKKVDLGSFGTHTVRISNMSACTNGETSETACGFVVEFVDIITKQKFNSTMTNVGGWRDSEMRTYVNEIIYNALPSELQNVIATTKVISSHGSTSGETNFETQDKLYLLNAQEVWNGNSYDTSVGTSKKLDYYKNQGVTASSYAGAKKQYNGSNSIWWLRSAYSSHTGYSLGVGSTGAWVYGSASDSNGVSPAFRIA